MKKSLIALGIMSSFAGAASAQSSVTLYGLLDAGLSYSQPTVPGVDTGNKLNLESGISTPSRFGITGSEDFGGTLKAIFQVEAGFQLNNGDSTQEGTLFNRASWVGLAGDFGTVKAGRQATPLFDALYVLDPFEIGFAGNANNLMSVGGANWSGNTLTGANATTNGGGAMFQNNSLRYVSHDVNGFSAEVNYGFGGQSGNHDAGSEVGATAKFENGPLLLLLSYDGVNTIDDSNKFKTTLIGTQINWSQYGFPMKTSIGYAVNKGSDIVGTPNVDSADLLIGARFPVGPHEVLLSYIRKSDKTEADQGADQFALGYTYAFSKRTSFYSSVGMIVNHNGALYTVGDASNAGYGQKTVDLGIRHAF